MRDEDFNACGRINSLDPVLGRRKCIAARDERLTGACGADACYFDPRTIANEATMNASDCALHNELQTSIIRPPGTFKDLEALHKKAYDRYWKERDCYEGDKIISAEAALLRNCCEWLDWILKIARSNPDA